MSGAQTATQGAEAATTEGPSFLDQVIGATKQTAPDQTTDLMKNLVEQAMAGTVTFDKNLQRTFERAIAAIDRKLSDQLNAIMHDPKFTKLEGTWRGLNYLVMNSETGTSLKIRVLNASKRDLTRDLQRAVEFDQSQLFKKIYENEFGTPGGEPYGALIGDYEWSQHPDDIETLRLISNVAAGAFAPFISAAGPGMFGFELLDRAGQAARPGKDLRNQRLHQVAQLPRKRGCALRQPGDAAHAGAPALWRGDQGDRRVQLRRSALRCERRRQGDGP